MARLVGFPRRDDGAPNPVVIGGVAYRGRDLRPDTLPAFGVTSKARSWSVFAPGQAPTQLSAADIGVLQGFPSDYRWIGSRTAQIAQAANAVPPPMAAGLLSTLI